MKLFSFAVAAVLACGIPAHATDVHTLLATPRQRVESSDFRASGHLVRVDAGGARTSEGITIKARWFPGVLHVLVEITSPAEARAHILIEMRTNGQNVIQIAHPGDKAPVTLPFEKWSVGPLGPVFSFEDFLQPEYFWPNQTALAETKFGARDCDIVKSIPAATDLTHYSEIKTWLDHSIESPIYVEKTLKGTGAVKEFTYMGLRKNGDLWYADQVEGKIRGQAGSTLLIIDRGSSKANLVLGDFSPERLIQF
jgi:hypothetical protein